MDSSPDKQEEIIRLLHEQLKVSHQILNTVEDTQRYVRWIRIVNVAKLLLILIPLVLAIIYLPPLFRQVAQTYGEMFKAIEDVRTGHLEQIDPKVLEKLLK